MTIRYEDAVRQGRDIIARHESDLWQLGKIASEVEPKYGEQTLAKLAEDWDNRSEQTVQQYRQGYLAYDENTARAGFSFRVAYVLRNEPDREQLLRRDDMTFREAERLVEGRRLSRPPRRRTHTIHTLAVNLAEQLDSILIEDDELNQQLNFLINNDAELETADRRLVETALEDLIQRLNQSLERFQRSELSGNVVTMAPQRRLT